MTTDHQDRRLSTDVDWLGGKLRPLREGKGVAISLILAEKPSKVKRVVPPQPKVVTIVPGSVFDLPATIVQVSVINNGCCFVEIDRNAVHQLILAGIPARLAKVLLAALRSTLYEENHGNCTTSSTRKKRPSSGAAGFKPRTVPSTSTITRSQYTCRKRGI